MLLTKIITKTATILFGRIKHFMAFGSVRMEPGYNKPGNVNAHLPELLAA